MKLISCLVAVALVILAGGCGGSSTATPSSSSSTVPPKCPNPEGGDCLGKLAAGTYSTQFFTPKLTYTVPTGWSNFEDGGGNFLLVPSRGRLAGVDPGTSDYISVYTSVEAEQNVCREGVPVPGVPHTPTGLAQWIGKHPGLNSTAPKPVAVGGLHGIVLDITLAKGAGIKCPHSPKSVGLMAGLSPSGFDHGLNAGLRMRLYLLSYNHGALAIEVDDVPGGGSHLAEYDALIKHLRFSQT